MTDQRHSEKIVRLKGELHKMHKTHVETTQEAEKRMHAELLEESSKMRAYKDQLEELVKATGNGNPEGVDNAAEQRIKASVNDIKAETATLRQQIKSLQEKEERLHNDQGLL